MMIALHWMPLVPVPTDNAGPMDWYVTDLWLDRHPCRPRVERALRRRRHPNPRYGRWSAWDCTYDGIPYIRNHDPYDE